MNLAPFLTLPFPFPFLLGHGHGHAMPLPLPLPHLHLHLLLFSSFIFIYLFIYSFIMTEAIFWCSPWISLSCFDVYVFFLYWLKRKVSFSFVTLYHFPPPTLSNLNHSFFLFLFFSWKYLFLLKQKGSMRIGRIESPSNNYFQK